MAFASVSVRPIKWFYCQHSCPCESDCEYDKKHKIYKWVRLSFPTNTLNHDDDNDDDDDNAANEDSDGDDGDDNRPRISIFSIPIPISDELCEFLDIPLGSIMSRSQVTKRISDYAKAHQLLNGHYMIRDERLFKLFPNMKKKFDILRLQQYLSVHYGEYTQIKKHTLRKNDTLKQELMEVAWHPDRIQRLIAKNPGMHWNHEEKAYTELDFNSMADIL